MTVKQGCKRDLELRDRDKIETFGFQSETRQGPSKNRSRDRYLVTKTAVKYQVTIVTVFFRSTVTYGKVATNVTIH